MFFELEKLEKRTKEIRKYIYKDLIEIKKFNAQEDLEKEIFGNIPSSFDKEIFVGENWKGWDKYIWLNTKVTLPDSWKDETIVGNFDFGKTGAGHNEGFESLCYLNGTAYQGVDSNHKEIFISNELAGQEIDLTFRLWSGLSGQSPKVIQEHKIISSVIGILDKPCDSFYHTSKMIIDTLKLADKNLPEYHDLLSSLNNAYKLIDYRNKASKEFYDSINKANQFLDKQIDTIGKSSSSTIFCVGHTHIDVAWLWRLKHTREKAIRSFSTVVRLMEKYPDYIFLQSQPQLYEYIKNDNPALFKKIKEKIKEGKWEVDGAMWLEADCNIISGESITRQILVGTNFVKEEFNETMNFLWLPDVFGYSVAMPQILLKSGLKTFVTSKISWNQYNNMPHDIFYWKGLDGSKILTYFLTASDFPHTENNIGTTYNAMIDAATLKYSFDNFKDKNISKDVIISYGYGDGGGGVNREMLENIEISKKLPLLPKVKTTKAKDFLDLIHEKVESTDEYIHEWDGELYLEYHRGTYTSQSNNKKSNRQLEILYRNAEIISSINSLNSNWQNYKHNDLLKGWKIILRNQFHDIIPGSSIHEVYEDCKVEYAEATKIGQSIIDEALDSLLKKNNSYTIFNGSNWNYSGIVKIDCNKTGNFYKNDKLLESQYVDGIYEVLVNDIKGTSFFNIDFKEEKRNFILENQSTNKIETSIYNISWNDKGQLISIFDKRNDREVLKGLGNVIQIYEDKPMNYDAWDIDIFYLEKYYSPILQNVLVNKSELGFIVEFTYKYDKSTIKQNMIVYDISGLIEFRTFVDWHQQNELLKVLFDVDIRATKAKYQVQYGNIDRSNNWNTSWDMAKFECCGHQWADLSETGYGVALLNNCKYGYNIKGTTIGLSLLKSAISPDELQDIGKHEFIYGLLPHKGDFLEGKVEQTAWFLNDKLTGIKGSSSNEKQLIDINSDNITLDAIKKAENEDILIVRFHDISGGRTNLKINTSFEYEYWSIANLLEEPESNKNQSPINLTVKPFEIITLYIKI